jgi:hypothetical protein
MVFGCQPLIRIKLVKQKKMIKTMHRVIVFLTLIIFIRSVAFAQHNIASEPYPSSSLFRAVQSDTLYFADKHIAQPYKILSGNYVREFYPSGNLMAVGATTEAECRQYVDINGHESKRCVRRLTGKWAVYYDTIVQIKYSEILFDNEQEISIVYFYKPGSIKKQRQYERGIYTEREYDTTGKMLLKTQYASINNKKILLYKSIYADSLEKNELNAGKITTFFYQYYWLFYTLILILLGAKILLGFLIYYLYYRRHGIVNRSHPGRLLASMKGTFFIYVHPKTIKNKYICYIHNVIAIVFVVLIITSIFFWGRAN